MRRTDILAQVVARLEYIVRRSFAGTGLALAALLLVPSVLSQTAAPAAPQLSPAAAYAKVLLPLTITRASMANWSDSELAAFVIAMGQARLECAARSPQSFRGDDLIALARLCALAQQWSSVTAAATQYIASTDSPKPLLAQAYALQIDAALQMRDEPTALAASHAMLAAVPYDTVVDAALNEALHYLQLVYTPDALALYDAREPFVLASLRAARPTPENPAAAPVSVSSLYADGLAYAALEQFAGLSLAAAATVRDLDAALAAAPAPASPDDALPIADARRQYALLGQPLPKIPLTASLYAERDTPRINPDYGAATALFLFPPWCAQCARMGQSFMSTLLRLSDENVHLYGLLAQPPPPVPATPAVVVHANGTLSEAKHKHANTAPPEPELETPKTAADLLRHTPTLIVPPETLDQFAASSFPLLIATDSKGIIRFIQPAPETALNPGDFLDQVTGHIAAQWPRAPK